MTRYRYQPLADHRVPSAQRREAGAALEEVLWLVGEPASSIEIQWWSAVRADGYPASDEVSWDDVEVGGWFDKQQPNSIHLRACIEPDDPNWAVAPRVRHELCHLFQARHPQYWETDIVEGHSQTAREATRHQFSEARWKWIATAAVGLDRQMLPLADELRSIAARRGYRLPLEVRSYMGELEQARPRLRELETADDLIRRADHVRIQQFMSERR
jgi:hypothetical protein